MVKNINYKEGRGHPAKWKVFFIFKVEQEIKFNLCENCNAACSRNMGNDWLHLNDRAMIRWICNVKANDEVSSDSLL